MKALRRRFIRWAALPIVLAATLAGMPAAGAVSQGIWQSLAPALSTRTEASYVQLDGKFYLIGGTLKRLDVYDPITDSWSSAKPMPVKLNHVQAVTVGGKIYVIGGLVSWPSPEVATVYIYDPVSDTWSQGTPMPRGRGAGGTAVYQGKIYYAGGLNGGIAVPWFDGYDPATDTWTQLPDMPIAREHFHAAVVNGKLWVTGGRQVAINNTVTSTVAFNFTSATWETGFAPIPTPRGGFGAAVNGNEMIVFGGESGGIAHPEVEAYDTTTNIWRTLAPMLTPMHGIEAAECNGGVYFATGATDQGGGNSSTIAQAFFPDGTPTTCGGSPPPPPPVGFGKSTLVRDETGATLGFNQPTTLQFGPDGRLYVGLINGSIKIYTVVRNAANDYTATFSGEISAVKSIPNHNDDGTLNATCPALCKRLLTGILVTGTAQAPVIYATSSDPRIGGGAEGADLNLDTNSGTVSRLVWNGSSWVHTILVRGLPRSEENHSPNGMALDPSTNTLYIAQGGNSNAGATSNNFALLPEYALSGAILSVNLGAITSPPYDLPTLDDENRVGNPDANDPFGGDDGLNQAKLVPGGPVQVYAPGFRNPYDVVITQSGRMYTVDNGPNAGWGDVPINEGPAGNCTNAVNEPGATGSDTLHFISGPGYYGGHPNPTRANPANTFNASNPQSPVSVANPIECDFQHPSVGQGSALTSMSASTNGIDEYTADNFGGAMQGDLLAAGYVANEVQSVTLNAAGDQVVSQQDLFSNVGQHPLDLDVLGPSDPFPGTIWVADIAASQIFVFEPNDFGGGGGPTCTGADDPNLDEDGDGFTNADEIDNGTDPCSSADVPSDNDGDHISDLNDPDDDNDGLPDTSDPFAVDANNGTATQIPVDYSWENDAPNPGGLLDAGFTGLMTNGTTNYRTLFDPSKMTVGGAAGVFTVDEVDPGDASKAANSQKYGFQFGVMPASGTFTVQTRILAPFAGLTPQNNQSMGLMIGDGTQSNFVKLVTMSNSGAGGVQFWKELGDVQQTNRKKAVALPGPDFVDLFMTINPSSGTVQPSYQVTTGGVPAARTNVGNPVSIPATWFGGSQALAVGIISTSKGPGPVFPATWDFMRVYLGT